MWPLIGINRPTQSSTGTSSAIRPRRTVRLDAVVHDLEARTVEALDLFEVAREAARDRDVRVGERRDRAVSEREARVLAELVEAVLRRHAQRHARQRSGELPVDVRVHEMRVEDLRPPACEIPGEPQERERVDVGREGNRVERDAAARQLAREVPGTRLVLVQHQEPDVPAPLLQSRQQREQMRLRARDPGHLLQVQDGSVLTHRAAARIPSAHVSTECRSCHALAQRAPDLGSFAFVEPGEPAQTLGKALRRVALEEQRIAVEQLVEHGIGCEHRQAGRRSFVHDLVRRSRLHVVDEDVRAREQLGNLRRAARRRRAGRRAARGRCDADARARSARRREAGRRRLRPAATARRIVSIPLAGE